VAVWWVLGDLEFWNRNRHVGACAYVLCHVVAIGWYWIYWLLAIGYGWWLLILAVLVLAHGWQWSRLETSA
jgi:hypothetical protein